MSDIVRRQAPRTVTLHYTRLSKRLYWNLFIQKSHKNDICNAYSAKPCGVPFLHFELVYVYMQAQFLAYGEAMAAIGATFGLVV